MEAKAIAKYVRMSPVKVKPVTDLIRGKNLDEALAIRKGCDVCKGQRGKQPRYGCFQAVRCRCLRKPGPHHEAVESRCSGPCVYYPEEKQPHRRYIKGKIIQNRRFI